MKCKKCNSQMIKTSDLMYNEVLNFIEGNLTPYILILIEKKKDILGTIEIKKSIHLRKIEKSDKNKVKLYGLKTVLIDGIAIIDREYETITYRNLEITENIIEIIVNYMKTQTEATYSNTKLNNYLGKKSPLKEIYIDQN